MQQFDRSKITEEPIISSDPCGGRVCDECEIGGCDHGIESELNPDLKAQMERNISPIIDSESWKDTYLQKLRESRETGKPLSEICESDPKFMESHRLDLEQRGLTKIIDADRTQVDHIRIQARILQEHRFKLRDQK